MDEPYELIAVSVVEVIVRVYNETDRKGADLWGCGQQFKSGTRSFESIDYNDAIAASPACLHGNRSPNSASKVLESKAPGE
jgi:hypothetical protein